MAPLNNRTAKDGHIHSKNTNMISMFGEGYTDCVYGILVGSTLKNLKLSKARNSGGVPFTSTNYVGHLFSSTESAVILNDVKLKLDMICEWKS